MTTDENQNEMEAPDAVLSPNTLRARKKAKGGLVASVELTKGDLELLKPYVQQHDDSQDPDPNAFGQACIVALHDVLDRLKLIDFESASICESSLDLQCPLDAFLPQYDAADLRMISALEHPGCAAEDLTTAQLMATVRGLIEHRRIAYKLPSSAPPGVPGKAVRRQPLPETSYMLKGAETFSFYMAGSRIDLPPRSILHWSKDSQKIACLFAGGCDHLLIAADQQAIKDFFKDQAQTIIDQYGIK